MRIRPGSWLIAITLVLLASPLPSPATAATSPVRPLFSLSDPRISEASGLAVGHRSPSVLYLHNDSGDSARFFAVDARTGRTRAVYQLPGARNLDWEDLATGPDQRGVASVWLADIGDNDALRSEVQLYRVDEPAVDERAVDERAVAEPAELTTGRPQLWRLRYPDGPHDAESLIADPVRHRLYLITKSLFGRSEVFEVPASPDPSRVQALSQVGTLSFGLTGTPGGPNPIGQLTATGASISADGSLVAVRTYTDAYLWPVSDGDLAAALRRPPTRIALPPQRQGEGIAFGAGGLLVDSEGVDSPVYRVLLPHISRPAAPSPTGSPSRAEPAASPAAAHRGSSNGQRLLLIAFGAALATTAALLSRNLRRRRR